MRVKKMKHMSWNVTVTTISVCVILNPWFGCSGIVLMLVCLVMFGVFIYPFTRDAQSIFYMPCWVSHFWPMVPCWGFHTWGYPQKDALWWKIMEHPSKVDDLGVPHDLGNFHVSKQFNFALQGIGSPLWDAQGMMVWCGITSGEQHCLYRCNLFEHVGKSHTHTCWGYNGYNILVQRKWLFFPLVPWWTPRIRLGY